VAEKRPLRIADGAAGEQPDALPSLFVEYLVLDGRGGSERRDPARRDVE